MSSYQLNAEPRTVFGSNAVKKLRRDKLVPAQIYGQGKPNLNLVLAAGDVEKAIQSPEPLLQINVGSEKRTVLIKDVHRDPVKGTLQHIDFYEVAMDRPVDTTVGVVLTGEGERESDGGIVNLVVRELAISCLPTQIPEHIAVDISKMTIGDTLLIKDLQVPDGITINHEPDEVVVSVATPVRVSAETEEAEAEAAEGQEPEQEQAPEAAGDAAGEDA
ncbi:MAG TPA: 50S ribosomal protein L25 [Firmicutes bacterium]|nr:50S ribosomal protein L25 [Bacillota bacterium]